MNTHITKETRQENGSAIIAVMFFAILISLAAGNIFVMARQEMSIGRQIIDRTSAQQIAEGAACQALGYLATDVNYVTAPPSAVTSGTLGNGTYSVSIRTFGTRNFEIESTGTVGSMIRTIRVYGSYPSDSLSAFNKAFFTNADLKLTGGGAVNKNVDGGDTHSNQDTDLSGHVTLTGAATSTGSMTVSGSASAADGVTGGVDPIDFPELDFDYYYNIARANGQVYNGNLKLSGTYTPPGGVMWVNGDVSTKSHVTIHGALFVTGDIHQASQFTQTKYDTFPAMVSRNGNMHLSGQTEVEGVIMAQTGSIDLTGVCRINGSVIAWGDIFTRGNWGVVNFQQEEPELEDDGQDTVEVFVWEM
jgi:cytoskeletal protein CcmA (bactofilin family)